MHTSTHRTRPRRRPRSRLSLTQAFSLTLALAGLAGCSSYQPLLPPELSLPPGVDYLEKGDYILLAPTGTRSEDLTEPDAPFAQGIVFYPGGLVAPRAYVSMLAPLAADGIPVAVLRVPADLAVLSPNRARSVLDGEDGSVARTWTLAGHSLGGAMAARFLARNAAEYTDDDGRVLGLILMASYPAASDSLAESDQPVLSIWAQNDGLATEEDRMETSSRLPPDTRFATIEGGNHAGFGEYGPQDDDGELEIPLEEQHRKTRELVEEFLAGLEDQAP
ncbi:MAG: alpha/beta hydrolase [Spirochaetota bacterium]